MKKSNFTLALSLLASSLISPALMAGSMGDGVTTSPMMEMMASGQIPAESDSSTLTRRKHMVTFSLDTTDVAPSTPHTVWAVVFNNPSLCKTTPCSGADLSLTPGHHPYAKSSLVWAGGGVSNSDGSLSIVGAVPKMKGAERNRDILFGHGLLSTKNAEIHFVVRAHGKPVGPLETYASVSSFGGACNDTNLVQPTPCSNVQVSIRQPK